jgi:hypothetical protein
MPDKKDIERGSMEVVRRRRHEYARAFSEQISGLSYDFVLNTLERREVEFLDMFNEGRVLNVDLDDDAPDFLVRAKAQEVVIKGILDDLLIEHEE